MALPDAVTARRVTLTSVVLCTVLLILSLVTITALALSSREAGGKCLLYTDKDGFGPSSACAYIYTVTAVFQFVCCLLRAVLAVLLISGVLQKDLLSSFSYVVKGWAVVDMVACVLTLVSGGILSHGFAVLCSKLFYPHSDRCGTIPFYSLSTSTFIKDYYTQLNIAQVSVWVSWVAWTVLVAADLVLLWMNNMLPVLPGPTAFRPGSASVNPISPIRRDKSSNQSQRSGVFLLFRSGGGDSDTESGPRTPPPRRPVPPRPPASAAAAAMVPPASALPLIDGDRKKGERC